MCSGRAIIAIFFNAILYALSIKFIHYCRLLVFHMGSALFGTLNLKQGIVSAYFLGCQLISAALYLSIVFVWAQVCPSQ